MTIMKIGNRLQTLRKENKLSQEDIATRLGVSRQSISLWENDQTYPTMENMFALCDIYNISLNEITGYSINKNTGNIFQPISFEGTITFNEILKSRGLYFITLLLYTLFYGVTNTIRLGFIFGIVFFIINISIVVLVLLFLRNKYHLNEVKKNIIFYEDFFMYNITYKDKFKNIKYFYKDVTLSIKQNEYCFTTLKGKIILGRIDSLSSSLLNHLESIKFLCLTRLNTTKQNYIILNIFLTIFNFISLILMAVLVTSKDELWLALLLIIIPVTNLLFAIKSKNIVNNIFRIFIVLFASILLFLTLIGLLVTQLL